MKKCDFMKLIAEGIQEYLSENPPAQAKQPTRDTIKQSELKHLVKEVVRQVVKEAGPQYKVQGKKSQVEQPGKINRAREIQKDPVVNENEKVVEASYKVVQPNLTQTAKVDKAKKIQTEPKVQENHKVNSHSYATILDVPQKPENIRDPEVDYQESVQPKPKVKRTENHKVQDRSHIVVSDLPNDPNNVRNPRIPSI
jgi:hypothetical protein